MLFSETFVVLVVSVVELAALASRNWHWCTQYGHIVRSEIWRCWQWRWCVQSALFRPECHRLECVCRCDESCGCTVHNTPDLKLSWYSKGSMLTATKCHPSPPAVDQLFWGLLEKFKKYIFYYCFLKIFCLVYLAEI